ncbi:unnamed protein product, partial [Mesorhabditis belari]|uniref:Uncharacterized protein n=1 Tax=Mesorhabditis belari TaxID=2138241 RepID=A0AAF3J948_9BILA
MTVEVLDFKGKNVSRMDIVMNEFLYLIREDPKISLYETRILEAFFEIESEQSRCQTLTRVVNFMKNCLPKLREKIGNESSKQAVENFKPIKEFDGSVLVVRHENWEALVSWMPLEIIQNSTLTNVWYTPMLAFYLSDTQLSEKDLKVIMESCRRRRDQKQISQRSSSRMVTHNDERAPSPPARSSSRLTRSNFSCPICFDDYDQSSHKPMIISECGHTLCQTCVNRLVECAECRAPIQRVIVNFAFKNAIEERDVQVNQLKNLIFAQENEKKTTEETIKLLQNELETKMALLVAETLDKKVSHESIQERQKAQFEIENLKKQLAQIKEKAKLETEKKTKNQASVEKHMVLVSGLPEKKPTATKIFKDLIAAFTDEPLKIEFVKPASLGQALVTFNQLDFALKFITLYNQKSYGDTDFLMKIELFKETSSRNLSVPTKDEHSDSEISRSSSPSQPNRNLEIDKTKIFIKNLPSQATNQNVIKWIFKDNPNLVLGSLSLKLDPFGMQTCIAKFRNEKEVDKIISEFNNKVYPGTETILHVQHFKTNQPKGRSKSRDPQPRKAVGGRFSGRPSLSPTRSAQSSNFSNLAQRPQDQFNPFNFPMPPMIPQFPGFQILPPPYQPQIFPNIYQNNQITSPTIFISNLPLSTSRADLIEYFHNKTLEGESIQVAEVDGIKFLPSLQPNPIHKTCLITFKTPRAAQLAQRYFFGKPFQHPGCFLNIELRGLQPQTSPFMQENRVLIKNLPASVTENDLVEMFHQICKIAHDQDLRPKINLKRLPNGTSEAIISFQTLEGAQRISLLYKAHDFQGKTIHASLI